MNREEIIKENEPDWEERFEEINSGYAILQVSDDNPQKRDIRFCSYDEAVTYLNREPCREDYRLLYVEELAKDKIDEIVNINARYDKNTALGDYVYEKFNADTRPNIDDGYYGTSLSMSDVVLIKENEEYKALYVDRYGFKEIQDFKPFLQEKEHGIDVGR